MVVAPLLAVLCLARVSLGYRGGVPGDVDGMAAEASGTGEIMALRSPLHERMNGVCHIMITPFTRTEDVDHQSVATLVRDAASAGACAVVPLGIMGEAHKLLDSERRAVLDTVVAAAAGEVAVIAGVSADSTFVASTRAREAADAGADAVMLAPPRNATVGPGLVEHYRTVAKASELPMVVQDEPVTTGVKMPGSLFTELQAVDGIVAAKVEEVPSPQKISAIRTAAPSLTCVGGLGGISFFEELERGADGIMTGFGYPSILVDIHRAYASGDREEARKLFYHYLPLIRFEAQLGVGGVGIRKSLFAERGLISNPAVRKPAPGVDEQTIVELRELIDVLGLGR